MYKEKCVKIPNSSEIREILIKIHYLWKTNTHRHAHTRCDLLSFAYLWTIGNSKPSASYSLTAVVICFHFSIFEPLETAKRFQINSITRLWFAFILVSLNHWKQLLRTLKVLVTVVICFHFSIFEPLETAFFLCSSCHNRLWFAFILVSLNHWKQLAFLLFASDCRCDLLSF